MRIKLVLGKEERSMSTDNGIPRVGDFVEWEPAEHVIVKDVTWSLLGYREGCITHQAVIELGKP